jgi:hypothetical protein
MHATIRRYDGVDQNRTTELTGKVNEALVAKLRKLPGFKGYYLIEAGGGVFSSLGLFETREQGEEFEQARPLLDPRREARDADAQRAQDHERQDHRSERSRGRVTRPPRSEGSACRPLRTLTRRGALVGAEPRPKTQLGDGSPEDHPGRSPSGAAAGPEPHYDS